MNKKVTIVIPNFNGTELLRKNLPILLKQTASLVNPLEIIVVDDGSSDGSVQFLKENFPQVKVIALGKNCGFSYACNTGVKEAQGEIVYLLNSDIEVCEGFLEPLLTHFSQGDVFAVSSAEAKPLNQRCQLPEDIAIPLVKLKWGIFWYWYEKISEYRYEIEVYCVSGGHTAYDRKKFLALGGFNTLFRPFYAEDGDICWRAWKKGWRSLYEPKSLVCHACQGTIGRYYSPSQIQVIHWKNRFLMTWKNLTAKRLIAKHILFLIPEVMLLPLFGRWEFSFGFVVALKQLPEVIKARRRDAIEYEIYPDDVLFKKFSREPLFSPYRILYLHETSKISGAEYSLLNLVRGINKNIFNVSFVLPEEGPLADELKKIGVEIEFIKFPQIRKLAGVFSTKKKIQNLVRKKRVNLLHSNSIRTHIYASMVGKAEKIPVVWHQRNLITTEIIDPDRLLSFLPDRIICNSRTIAERFLQKGKLPAKVTVVYNGVDTDTFNPSIPGAKIREELNIKPEEIVVGITSRFGPDKGHVTFLKAAQILANYNQPFRFLIVGHAVFEKDYWRKDYLKNIVKYSNLTDKILFTGFRKDMPQIYAAMDIFVLASDAEPCGRVLFEAMACAKPVVATNSGGTPELVEDGVNGFLVEPKDTKMLVDKIDFLARNPELAKKMGETGRKKMETHFKIQENISETENIYLALLLYRTYLTR